MYFYGYRQYEPYAFVNKLNYSMIILLLHNEVHLISSVTLELMLTRCYDITQ